ncbi:hypothetical protein BH09SUM1_BH09SUM1_14250 [soil metagenome]
MKSNTWLAGVLTASLAFSALGLNRAGAEQWFDNKWVWGGTGLLAGGIIGNEIGKSHERSHYRNYGYAPTYQSGPYYYADGPVLTGQSYTQDTRVWPFYHRTTVYPIASTQPVTYNPQSVSLAVPVGNYYGNGIAGGATREDSTRDLNISVGDNNENVRINVGRDGTVTEKTAPNRQTVSNYGEAHPQSAKKTNRMVDAEVVEPGVQTATYERTDRIPQGAKAIELKPGEAKFSVPALDSSDVKSDEKKSDSIEHKRDQK